MNGGKKKLIVNVLLGFVIIFFVLTFYNTFSLSNDYKFESMVYDIRDGYIKDISVNTTVELFVKYFDINNCSIAVVDKNNDKIVSGYVFNGSKTVVYDVNGRVITSYINIIKGDFNGDGIIDMNDFYDGGKCLVDKCLLEEYVLYSIDIDNDLEFHINDLVLLDKAVTFGYSGISFLSDSIILQENEVGRLVSIVVPGYGINRNVLWSSEDESIATVDEAGRVTGHKEGETFIVATTLDGKYSSKAKVRVDNTIQLESYKGIAYIGGNDLPVKIKAVDYDGITCSLSKSEIADCEIENKKLILKPKNVGDVVVTVVSSKYGEVSYNLEVQSVYLNVMPKYLCTTPGNVHFITVSGFNTGELKFDIEDESVIKSAYMEMYQNRRLLRINFGDKQGRTTLKVTEGNGNTSNEVVVDVTYMGVSDFGKVTKVGQEVVVSAIGDNLGTLTCKVDDDSIGTCRVEGNNIIVTPLKIGFMYVDVYNNFSYEGYEEVCGQSQFMVVIQE